MRVAFVVESEPAKGLGHLSRMRVLAAALADRGAAVEWFLTAPNSAVPATLLAAGEPVPDGVVIVDGYDFDDALLRRLKANARRLALVDDLADRPFPADVVLNHNFYGLTLDYSAYGAGRLLLGPPYALIRPAFFEVRAKPEPPRVLVTMGGGATAALGESWAAVIAERAQVPVDVASGKDDLAALMAGAGLVVCGLGVTFMEALAAGRPVIGVQLAANQRFAYAAARDAGFRVFETLDPDVIAAAAAAMLAAPAPAPVTIAPGGAARAAAEILTSA